MKKYTHATTRLFLSLTIFSSGFAPMIAIADSKTGKTPKKERQGENKITIEKPLEIDSSNQLFRKYVSDPLIHNAFRSMQWQLLNLKSDSELTRFFQYGHPILTELYSELTQAHAEQVQNFSMMAQTNMVKVENGLTTRYNKLIQMINEVALDLGFNQEAINSLELYLMAGSVNAFTVSGNDRRIIVVVQSELIEKMEDVEIRAVIAHELGHIRSLHSLQGEMNLYMMKLLGVSLSMPEGQNFSGSPEAQVFSDLENRNLIAESEHGAKVINSVLSMSGGRAKKNAQDQGQQLFFKTLSKLQNLPPQHKAYVLSGYILHTLNTMVEMNSNPESIQYFSDLYMNIQQLGSISISGTQFNEHAAHAMAAISRSDESSADQYASAGNPNENIASAFGKLLGLAFARQERSDIFKLVKKQAEDFESRYTAEERSPFMGNTHPALILRINNILNMPAYPAVLFANRFLKLLVLESAIRQELGEQSELAEAYTSGYNETQKRLAHEEQDENFIKFSIQQSRVYEQNMVQASDSANRLYVQHNALIDEIIQSVIRLNLSAKINPRLNNIIEHFSYIRETEINSLKEMRAELKNPELTKEEKKTLHNHMKNLLLSLKQPNEILVSLKANLETELLNVKNLESKTDQALLLQTRIEALDLLMTTKSPQVLEKLRNDFIPKREAGTVADRRRVPTEIEKSKLTAATQACAKLLTM